MVYEAPKVAMYIRLSREDLRLGESLSVENQRILLTNYAEEQGWRNVTEYVDDGYSGVNFDRPSFKRMMNDVHEGKINLIICKDCCAIIGLNQKGLAKSRVSGLKVYLLSAFAVTAISLPWVSLTVTLST